MQPAAIVIRDPQEETCLSFLLAIPLLLPFPVRKDSKNSPDCWVSFCENPCRQTGALRSSLFHVEFLQIPCLQHHHLDCLFQLFSAPKILGWSSAQRSSLPSWVLIPLILFALTGLCLIIDFSFSNFSAFSSYSWQKCYPGQRYFIILEAESCKKILRCRTYNKKIQDISREVKVSKYK